MSFGKEKKPLPDLAELLSAYEEFKGRGLSLDMSRGKPDSAQLDLSMEMMDALGGGFDYKLENGADSRNYGELSGIPEAKRLLAPMMGAKPENLIVCGSSSLNIMYDMVSAAVTHGVLGSTPWGRLPAVKFLCPSPGYDRHFAITQHFGIEMIPVPMNADGPDMDMVERLVAEDDSVKGIWCVPKYSNPQGITYAAPVVDRFARLTPKAVDFRIFWDNAYAVHDLYDEGDTLLSILEEAAKHGNEDIVYEFASTSKVTFPGAGIAAIAVSERNKAAILKQMSFQTIGHNKINQLRHVRYFGGPEGIASHMKRHAALLRPKFETVLRWLDAGLAPYGIGSWNSPRGGYFISFEAPAGCAKRIVSLCAGAGVKLTGAGATYPLGIDPKDSNLRIAPTYPTPGELSLAMELFVLCAKIAAVEVQA